MFSRLPVIRLSMRRPHALREETVAEVRSEESGAAGDQRSLHAPVPIPDDGRPTEW